MGKYAKTPGNVIVYPNLEKWIKENCKNAYQFSIITGLSDRGIRCMLYGRNDPSKYTIDVVLQVTGLTYEVAFAKGEKR